MINTDLILKQCIRELMQGDTPSFYPIYSFDWNIKTPLLNHSLYTVGKLVYFV
jgi:hypothetical protein